MKEFRQDIQDRAITPGAANWERSYWEDWEVVLDAATPEMQRQIDDLRKKGYLNGRVTPSSDLT